MLQNIAKLLQNVTKSELSFPKSALTFPILGDVPVHLRPSQTCAAATLHPTWTQRHPEGSCPTCRTKLQSKTIWFQGIDKSFVTPNCMIGSRFREILS